MKKSLILDLGFLVIIVCLLAVVLFPKKPQQEEQTVFVSVKVVREFDSIYPEVQKGGEVFFNSQKQPVKIVNSVLQDDAVIITVQGRGKIEDERYLFNGARILVGQKAELHGRFFAQGIITEVKNDN